MSTKPTNYGSTEFDSELKNINSLTWEPWIGKDYKKHGSLKLLIVGESHYVNGEENTTNEVNGETVARDQWRDYTRATVREAFVNDEWRTPMHSNLHRLLHATTEFDRERFWAESAYMNIVQRPMDYSIKEQASAQDFVDGWKTLFEVIKIIKPTYCLMVGSRSAHHFNHAMDQQVGNYVPVKELAKIGRYLARGARVTLDEDELDLVFIKHASSYFSWQNWRGFLQEHSPSLMGDLKDRRFTASQTSL